MQVRPVAPNVPWHPMQSLRTHAPHIQLHTQHDTGPQPQAKSKYIYRALTGSNANNKPHQYNTVGTRTRPFLRIERRYYTIVGTRTRAFLRIERRYYTIVGTRTRAFLRIERRYYTIVGTRTRAFLRIERRYYTIVGTRTRPFLRIERRYYNILY